ncbi:MAG TPA: hypothetical protein V6D08_21280 [Candidatus Obscuribacterales bacterium]
MSKIFHTSLFARQNAALKLIEAAVERDRLMHAYLLSGRGLADKWLIASQLAGYLNCSRDDKRRSGSCLIRQPAAEGICLNAVDSRANFDGNAGRPRPQVNSTTLGICLNAVDSRANFDGNAGRPRPQVDSTALGICLNCQWIASNQHPQAFMVLSGEGATGKVPVESARRLAAELARTSQFVRVVVVPDATEAIFHRPAANALLKTIEEPGPRCLFLMFAPHEEDVLATIVSRCQVLPVLESCPGGFWLPAEARAAGFDLTEKKALAGRLAKEVSGGKAAGRWQALTAALEWAHELAAMESDETPRDRSLSMRLLVDLVASLEAEKLSGAGADHHDLSLYLTRLLELAEKTKEQIEHYVPARPALEAFALAFKQLSDRSRSSLERLTAG